MNQHAEHDVNPTLPLTGILFGALAAIGYTSANGFLRQLSESADPAWVSTSKAFSTVFLFGPWVAWMAIRGKQVFPRLKTIGVLIFAGVSVQLAGNLLFQMALAEIGVALIVPLTLGSMVVSGAIAGRIFLKEPVTQVLAVALFCLIVSIFVLGLGSTKVKPTENTFNYLENFPESIRGTIACICASIAGITFTILGVSVRFSLRENIPSATPMVIVGLCGLFGLGSFALANNGTALFFETTGDQWFYMAMVGLSNSLAFLSLTKALKKLPVVYVNAINVSQVAMATIIGVTIFGEPLSNALLIGLAIMFVGFSIMTIASARKSRSKNDLPNSISPGHDDETWVSPQDDPNDQRPKNLLVELGVTKDSNNDSSFVTSDSIHSENEP